MYGSPLDAGRGKVVEAAAPAGQTLPTYLPTYVRVYGRVAATIPEGFFMVNKP